MRFTPFLLAASMGHSAFGAVIATPEGKRAVFFGKPDASIKLTRRGEEYDLDRLDDLDEEAGGASKDQVYQGIDYLVNIWNSQGISYGIMGGVALQLYGYEDRETHDSDMVISVNSRDLLDKIRDDPNIARPSLVMAASGTARLFINLGDQHVGSDIFVQGADLSPELDTQEVGGYNVLKVGPLIKSKFGRGEDKDKDDVLWLIMNKGDDVKAAADSLDYETRIEWAKEWIEEDDDLKDDIVEVFNLNEDDLESDDDDEDDD